MKVKLHRRLGQHNAGTVVDVSQIEAEWLIQRGAEAVDGGASEDTSGPTLAELRDEAARLDLKTYGSKAQLQARIDEAKAAQ